MKRVEIELRNSKGNSLTLWKERLQFFHAGEDPDHQFGRRNLRIFQFNLFFHAPLPKNLIKNAIFPFWERKYPPTTVSS